MIRRFLLIPHIKIHNANAMSSPYTVGFPAMTAWLGAVHSLQRHFHQNKYKDLSLVSVAVSCHHFELQSYKGQRDFIHSIIGTANPLDKDGSRPSFVEEPRCHLEVSLLIEYQGIDSDDFEEFLELINKRLHCMKIAGGDVLAFKDIENLIADDDNAQEVRKILSNLMLGYVLIERKDLMIHSMINENKDALDALLDHLKVMHRSTQDENGNVTWTSSRKTSGWIVPIATGFQGISSVEKAINQRDESTPHRFAESIVTLGEFVMPYRISNLDQVLWAYDDAPKNDLYICQTLYTKNNLIGE